MKRSIKFRIWVLVCLVLTFISSSLFATTLPDIIGDHMVLKQNSNVALWGWDKPNTAIRINTGWNNKEYQAQTDERGEWKIFVKTPKAGGPYTIRIEGTERIELKDILIGEVWFTSGQSNIGWNFLEEENGQEVIDSADNGNIRLFRISHQIAETEKDNFQKPDTWKICSPKTVANFSAMSYYFASQLQKELNVPVGIVTASWGGTGIESWISYDLQSSDEQLRKAINRWNGWVANCKEDSIKYHQSLEQWKTDSINGIVRETIRFPKSLYMTRRPHCKPGATYNGMVSPIIPYTISGFIWYQGENSVEWADEYEHQMENLIDSWRAAWKQDFPVLIGQLTNFNYHSAERAATVREAQLKMERKKDTYVICTIDIGDNKDVHPVNKRPFGKRFADLALNKVYKSKGFPANYPTVNKISRKDNQIIVEFKNAKGLCIKGEELNDIFIWDEKQNKVKARSYIQGNKLIIYHEDIQNPVGVDYAVNNDVNANLYNQENLPAYPFSFEWSDK